MKTKIFSIVLFLIFFTLVAQVPSYVPTNGLVAYYPFNGNANDVSTNGNSGINYGATPTTDRNGTANSALNFNGVNNYISIPYSTTIGVQQEISVSFWVLFNGGGCSPRIMQSSPWGQCGGFTIATSSTSNLSRTFYTNFENCTAGVLSPTSPSLSGLTWHHVVWSASGLTGISKMYFDGILVDTDITSGFFTSINYFNRPITIGNIDATSCDWFGGKLDDICIWNRILTPQEISPLFTTCATPPPAPVAAATQTFCATPAPTVTDLVATGTGVQWYDAATAGNLLASTATLTNGQIAYASQTVSGCESTRTAVTVNLNDPQITASATTVCSGTTVNLSASTTATLVQNCNLSTNLQNGLVGYWPFCGNANDTSGNNNNGTVNGATLTTDRFGNANNAYSFDGTSSYVEALNPLGNLTSNFTISSYVKISDWDGGLFVHLGIDQNGSPRNGFGYGYGGTQSVFPGQNYLGLVSNVSWYPSGYQFSNLNQWCHTAVVRTNNNLLFYINGINVGNATIAAIENPTNSLWFGCGSANYALLNGNIDDVAIFNRALSATEIAELYIPGTTYLWSTGETTATINPTPTATTTYWCDVTVNGVTCRKYITINVNSTTPAPTGAATQTFCATPAPTVTDLVATGTGVQWYDAATAGNLLASTATLTNGQIAYASQTVSGCESTRTAVTVNLNDPQITASATTVCSGTAVNLSASTTALPITTNSTLPTNLQNGLVGYWPFNGNANDESGNNNNGTVNGALISSDRFGTSNNSYSFNRNIQNEINVVNSNSLNSISNITISLWVKLSSYGASNQSGYNHYINKSDQNNNHQFVFANNNTELYFYFSGGGNYFPTNNLPPLNQWTNVIVTYQYDGTIQNSFCKFYINGNLVDSILTTQALNYSNYDLRIGNFGNSFYNRLDGQLDDIVIWNRALNSNEIQQLYSGTSYTWSTGETTATINPTPTATTTYWCDVTVNGVTCRKSVTITVNSTPAPTGAATQTFCATPAPTVADLVATGTGIQWYDAATGGNLLASTATLTNGQVVYASQTDNGCESITRTAVTVSLNDPQITASATTVCSGTAVSLSASTTATLVQNCNLPTNLQNGLVGYWPFCGNANDTSVNGNNGTVNGATLTTDRFGNANSAYSFDGVDDYLQCNSVNLNNTITTEFWYKNATDILTNITNGHPPIGAEIIGQGTQHQPFVSYSDFAYGISSYGNSINHFALEFSGPVHPQSTDLISNNLGITNQWNHVVVVRNGNACDYYLNGTLQDSYVLNNNLLNTGAQLSIGARLINNSFQGGNQITNYFKGDIDNVTIWNRVLNQSEIAQLYTPAPTYLWSTGETTATINPVPTATTTYWCDVTVNGVTCRKSVTITVNSTPAPTGGATQTFCATPAPTVADLVATGTGIQWYDAATAGNLLASTANLTNGQIVYASQTDNGCESTDRLAVTVSINDPQITASATTVCNGTAVNLSANTTATLAQNCNLPTNLQTGLVGYWPFCGNANDASGNGNNGTVNGATLSTDRFGNTDSAYSFDGISTYIDVTNAFFNNGWQDYTLSLWFNANSTTASTFGGLTMLNTLPHQGLGVGFSYNNSQNIYHFKNSDPSISGTSWNIFANDNFNTSPVNLNSWYNIGIVKNGNNYLYYLNGNLDKSTTSNISPISYLCSMRFGGITLGTTFEIFKGKLDDFAIYNRALSASEITQLYSSNNQTTYLWSTGETTATINPTPTATTIYWCDVTVNGVTCRKEIEITVNTTPAPTVITPVTYCQNSVAAPLTATGANFMWYTDATGGTGTSTAPTPDTTTPGSTTWYVSQSVAGCESTREAIVINVTPSPAPPLVTTPLVYCQNSSAIPLAATGTNLLWYTAPNAGIGSATAPTPSTSAAGSTFYYVSQTVFGCESPREIVEVSITPTPPTPVVTSPLTYCQYSNAVPLAATGTDLLWYTTSIGGSGSTVVPTPVTTFPGVRNYFVSQTISGCESPRAAIEVTITAVPFPPAVTNQVNYCQNSIATPLTATGTNLLWYTTVTGGTGSATAPTPDTTTAGITNYYVSQTVAGCEGSRATIIVSVIATPIAPPVLTPVTFCQYSTTSPLNALGPNLLWYTDPNLGTGSITAPTPDTATAGITTYYVSQSISGCEGPRAAIEVIISAAPSEPTVTTPVTYCQNSVALPLTATGSNLLWYTAATGGTGAVLAPTPITTIAGNTTYYVSQTVSGCESLRTVIDVIINAAPLEPTGNSSQYFCANIYPTIQNLVLNQNSLNWYSSATSSTALAPNTPLIPNTIYYAEQFDIITGCQSLTRLAVTVFIINENAPTIVDDLTFCEADEKTIGDINTNGAVVIWYDTPAGGTPLSSDYLLVNSQVLYAATYNSTTGCESLDRQTITITTFDCEVKANNLLTLDGNNLNDNLNLINIESFPANEIEIYNRYGQVVWRTDNYNNTTNTFKGRANYGGIYRINDNLPTGTYYYVLKYFNPYRNKYEVTKSYLYISNNN